MTSTSQEESIPAQKSRDKLQLVISETEELVLSKVAGEKEVGAKAVHDGKVTLVELGMGKMSLCGAEVVLEEEEDRLDHHLPMTDEELAEIAEPTPGGATTVFGAEGYFVRLGSLSAQLQHRAYRYAVAKMEAARKNIQEAFSQLCQVIRKVEYTKQGVLQKHHGEQEKLNQIESHVLAVSYHITQNLHLAYKDMVASIQGLPANFQQKLQLACHNMEELHAHFISAHSFKDLSSSILSQSKAKAIKAQKCVDDILEYVKHNAPLSWLVGPFASAPKESSEVMEPTKHDDRKGRPLKAAGPQSSM